jgi:transcriptional regulator GlxA family with amidase domain
LQTFHEARSLGADYAIALCGTSTTVPMAQGVSLAALLPLPSVGADDLIIVPGMLRHDQAVPSALVRWLRGARRDGAQICSVCTGAFVLGRAGLLDGRRCTTHWKRVGELQQAVPRAKVLGDQLFVRDGPILTSAGIASGIDMALAIVEEHHGPILAARVAREMVVYMRRGSGHGQSSVYLDYRTHLHAGVHEVQDYLVSHPAEKLPLPALAKIGRMSPRTLTRTFRLATGLSIVEFKTKVRLERAATLMRDPALTLDAIAEACGFADARQLRRVWRQAHGRAPRG